MLEKDLEKKIVKFAESIGLIQRKFVSPNRRFVLDRIFIYKNRFLFLEIKKDNKSFVHPGQLREVNKILEQGGYAHIVDNLEDAKQILIGFKNAVEIEFKRLSKETD